MAGTKLWQTFVEDGKRTDSSALAPWEGCACLRVRMVRYEPLEHLSQPSYKIYNLSIRSMLWRKTGKMVWCYQRLVAYLKRMVYDRLNMRLSATSREGLRPRKTPSRQLVVRMVPREGQKSLHNLILPYASPRSSPVARSGLVSL